jgi:uncharacterized membrane protein (UPF0127 family)
MMTTLMAVGFAACLQGEPSPGAGSGTAGSPSGAPGARDTSDARRAEVRFPRGRVIAAEIADTPAKVARGYMYRTRVGERDGMIFVFPVPDVHPFWMKNTLVPLDMIWMDEEFGVLHIQPSAPPCKADPCPSYGPPRKAAYVLEVRAGTAAEQGLRVGDRLEIVLPGGEGGGS